MPILSLVGIRPDHQDWSFADVDTMAALGKSIKGALARSETPENQQRWTNWLEANGLWQSGINIWVVADTHRLSFASEPRYVTEDSLSFRLEELISNAAYILDEYPDKDLSDPDVQQEIIASLTNSALAVTSDQDLLLDSFAYEVDFSSVIVRAIEDWEMQQPPKHAKSQA